MLQEFYIYICAYVGVFEHLCFSTVVGMCSGNEIQVVRLNGKRLYPLSYLTGLDNCMAILVPLKFFFICLIIC